MKPNVGQLVIMRLFDIHCDFMGSIKDPLRDCKLKTNEKISDTQSRWHVSLAEFNQYNKVLDNSHNRLHKSHDAVRGSDNANHNPNDQIPLFERNEYECRVLQ